MSDALTLPPGTRKSWRTESTLAQAEIEEITEGYTFRAVGRGTGRLVRVEEVHHYRQRLLVGAQGGGDVTLIQHFSRLDRLPPDQGGTTIRMTPAEARVIGRLLVAAADEAEPSAGPADPQGAGDAPNTASKTSEPPVSASLKVSETGSRLSANVSASAFSERRRSSTAFARLSASVGSLFNSVLISSRKITSTAICFPKAKSSLFGLRMPSSIESQQPDGSRPGEAVEHHAPGLAGVWARPETPLGGRA